jgi:peptidoglycan/xylan/chitin deacetylase (PgdA/CDA1 family)
LELLPSCFWGLPPSFSCHFIIPDERVGPTSLDLGTKRFEQHLRILKALRFKPITLQELFAIKSGERTPKGREIVITFDDGNQSFAEHALPLLEQYRVPSTNFVILENITKKLHGSMDLETVGRVAEHPLVTIGSHTLTHPTLTEIDETRARAEIISSKDRLEELMGEEIHYFSYPTGVFNDKAVALAKEAGYRLAFTTSWKHIPEGRSETLYTVTRTKVNPDDDPVRFWMKISGCSGWFQRMMAPRKN